MKIRRQMNLVMRTHSNGYISMTFHRNMWHSTEKCGQQRHLLRNKKEMRCFFVNKLDEEHRD